MTWTTAIYNLKRQEHEKARMSAPPIGCRVRLDKIEPHSTGQASMRGAAFPSADGFVFIPIYWP